MINNVGKKSVIVCDEATAQSMENRANAVAKLAEKTLDWCRQLPVRK